MKKVLKALPPRKVAEPDRFLEPARKLEKAIFEMSHRIRCTGRQQALNFRELEKLQMKLDAIRQGRPNATPIPPIPRCMDPDCLCREVDALDRYRLTIIEGLRKQKPISKEKDRGLSPEEFKKYLVEAE